MASRTSLTINPALKQHVEPFVLSSCLGGAGIVDATFIPTHRDGHQWVDNQARDASLLVFHHADEGGQIQAGTSNIWVQGRQLVLTNEFAARLFQFSQRAWLALSSRTRV